MEDFYNIKNGSNGSPVRVDIDSQIGEDYWGDGLSAKRFIKDLNVIGNADIELHINSPGGAVFDGQAIYTRLKQHQGNVDVYIDSLAASIASVIAMAGDNIYMPNNAVMMIHNPVGLAYGEADDMRKEAELLDTVKTTIINAYKSKTALIDSEVSILMDNETWLTAEKAKEYGFVDKIIAYEAKPFSKPANILNKFQKLPVNLAMNFLNKSGPDIPTKFYTPEEVLAIQNICNLVGKESKAKDFIKSGLREDQVKQQLFDEMVTNSEQEYINNKIPELPAENHKQSWKEASQTTNKGSKKWN